ncbi:TetR/AcrR family transcriptional regulator [Streptomyces tendae]
MTHAVRRAPRCDAERNHTRIIEFARDLFAHRPDTTLRSVAREAGVGQGTMYRHFPTLDHLLLAVYEEEIEELAAAAAALLEWHEPAKALRLWLERLAWYGELDTSAARAVAAATRADIGGPAYTAMSRALDALLDACRAEHRLRPGVSSHAVLLLMSYAWSGGRRCASSGALDVLDIVMDGLGTGGSGATCAAPEPAVVAPAPLSGA